MKLYNFYFLFIMVISNILNASSQSPKILHVSFHQGCIREFKFIAQELGLDLESVFIHDWVRNNNYDGKTTGNAVYNITHQRASDIWQLHHHYFEQFDVIITSDTAPLSRIFLQNDWKKPLIIWICNRFDYADLASAQGSFPDPAYYQLFRQATTQKNVHLISYNAFEHFFALHKGIDIGTDVIQPSGMFRNEIKQSSIPEHINKSETFFVPPRGNDESMRIVQECSKLGISCYRGMYNGPTDLQEFKGIIHFPYAWSNLALFENIQLGLPYFIPSKTFMLNALRSGKAWWPDQNYMYTYAHLSEWYNSDNQEYFIYFDSWQDLKNKIDATDFNMVHEKLKRLGQQHKKKVIKQWQEVFDTIKNDNQ
ncbi:MAG TPA: hypothetical protein PLU71_04625 [Candidatus Dependentiae bacterium]|nr:hypothetical protein [Candidatus Dependentiae bacterium]HRQ63118.1 hypothetical protein [Candidatus Dependentiae bacterium]